PTFDQRPHRRSLGRVHSHVAGGCVLSGTRSACFRGRLEILRKNCHVVAAPEARHVSAGGIVNPAPSRVAAFFDIDGTLIPFPTREKRLVRALLYRHAIPVSNFARWPLEWIRLLPRGFAFARQANKLYLRGLTVQRVCNLAQQIAAPPQISFFPQ